MVWKWIRLSVLFSSLSLVLTAQDSDNQAEVEEDLGEVLIERFNASPLEEEIGYSQAVRVGQLVFVSGTTAPGKTLQEQLKTIYIRIQSSLAQFNCSMDDVVQERIQTTDMEVLRKAQKLRKRFYKPGAYPTTTWTEVERLYDETSLVMVDVVAVIRKFD